jgi:DNA-binding Xre family transcriptional regulator
MVRLNLRAVLRARKVTAYSLAKETGLSLSTVYRLTAKDGAFDRIEAETIDAICAALDVTPGELIVRTAR